jgi:hypothetical protein
MFENLRRRPTPTGLLEIIAEVRRRWRLKLALRGGARLFLATLAVLLVAAFAMEWARFSPTSILAFRVLIPLALLAGVWWFMVRPLRLRVTDEQVALYLEEHEPSLQATLLSAVESTRAGHEPLSPALVKRVVEQALEACSRADSARGVERLQLRRYGLALGGVAVVALLTFLAGPAFIRHAMSALLLVAESVVEASPYRIQVTPGTVTIPKGADQTITASLSGFATDDVVLMVRRSPTAAFEPMPLLANEDGGYDGIIFDVAARLDYQVIADGVQSSVHTLDVEEVPYVQRMTHEYRFPAYTGLEPQTIENGGDIAVLGGTEVRLQIFPTMVTPRGAVTLNEEETIDLVRQEDGSLTAAFTVARDGSYRIELEAPGGNLVTGSPQYTIDVLADRAPSVSFNRPGRDVSVSSIEEVFVEANAEDDYGVRNLELVYSINGGPEQVVRLFSGDRQVQDVSAGHTFYVEELGVETGDSISYYARAGDNDGIGGAKQSTSNLYFMRIRPFDRDFRRAESQAGGGGGGGGGAGQQVEALSEQQRQIISATFNVQRDRASLSRDQFRENSTVVSLSQSRLREQVEGLLTRMNSQLVEQDPAFATIAALLPQAVEAMKEAESRLDDARPDDALPLENRALQFLQKAEEEYETQISVQQAGGGGGGGGGAMQQELADIFEQELDQMANRYETANQSAQESAEQEVDELLEKLKELARRQEQEAERQRRRALQGQSSGGGSGAQQRALAEEMEEAARRLERLAREEQRPDLQRTAEQLREAADAARRAAASGDAQAQAQAQAALERLRESQRELEGSLAQRAADDVERARREADAIAREQQEIAEMVGRLPASPAARGELAQRINERKDELEARLGALENDLERSAQDATREERAAARRMSEAAAAISDNRLQDVVNYSQRLVERGTPAQASAAEADIARGIAEVQDRLSEAQAALGQQTPEDRREQALQQAERLARAAESMQERTRERAERGGQGQEGQGQEGQGQEGQGQSGSGQEGEGQQGRGQGQGQGQGEGQGEGQEGQGGRGGEGQRGGANGEGRLARGGQNGAVGGSRGGNDLGWGGWWNGAGVELSDEDIRQLRGEARQYADQIRDLQGQLSREQIDATDLNDVLRQLSQLNDDRIYQDVEELARLQQAVADTLKRFEFGLRRELGAGAGAIALSQTDEVPEEHRQLVEEYYRSLGRTAR